MSIRNFPAIILATAFLIPAQAGAFDLQGHRGARGLMPENTLPAFAKALSIGVSTLELDTGMTKDGKVVVAHNQRLEPAITRTPDGIWLDGETPALYALNYAQIESYDVGRIDPMSKMAKRFVDQQPVDGTAMPSLDDVFRLVAKSGNDKVRFNIETKINPLRADLSATPEQFAAAVLEVVKANGFEHRTAIQSFDWRTLRVVQGTAPHVPTVYLSAQQKWFNNVGEIGGEPSPWTDGHDINTYNGSVPKMVKAAGGAVWSPFFRDVDRAKVEEAQALGLEVIVWTVNDEADMNDLISMGVDGIITDFPDRLRKVMGDNGLPLPPATPVEP